MPNQGNKSKGRSGIVQKKRKPTVPQTQSQTPEETAQNNSATSAGQHKTPPEASEQDGQERSDNNA